MSLKSEQNKQASELQQGEGNVLWIFLYWATVQLGLNEWTETVDFTVNNVARSHLVSTKHT